MKFIKRKTIWILLVVVAFLCAVGSACSSQTLQPTVIVKRSIRKGDPQVNLDEPPQGIEQDQETQLVQKNEIVEAPIPQPVCGGPSSMSILVLGIDNYAQSDAIRLVRIDFVEKQVSVVAIPRDFYVSIVDMAEHDIVQGRINATYGYGERFNGSGQGIISLTNNLEYNFGVTFDRYLVLNFTDIAEYIDLIGGIDIFLDKPVADGGNYFSSGAHHMNGETAVTFMRIRKFDTDFARIKRQSMLLKAFFEKAMGEINLFEQLRLASEIILSGDIQSDFGIGDIYPTFCLANVLESDDIEFIEIPEEMYHSATTPSGGAVQIPHEGVAPFLQSVMDGSYQP